MVFLIFTTTKRNRAKKQKRFQIKRGYFAELYRLTEFHTMAGPEARGMGFVADVTRG